MAARLLRYSLDTEPMVVVAIGLGVIGAGSVAIVPGIRRSLGFDTTQYYGKPPSPSTSLTGALSWTKEVGDKPEPVAVE
eukprot:CAMPEP_0204827648 /NCGR_PEP_ID=MMETSP1346-20131115/5066_1 /ASSEMBLY_ACC=CAM_ASM_000771 /TAXON_ID=215587 /ORGANISM="Aplanochytrium stocchinoi, Strain GSBS06" /LENGTH=78 /DNA_ID=CAMNT_0051956145 /DNA_START=95 /DNA_END=331 /DNA_ORIENTATION=-